MIVCSCNVLSDHEIRLVATAAPEQALSPCRVHQCLGCRVQCGRCARAIRRIIADAATATLVGVTAADATPRQRSSASASQFNLAGTGNYEDERFAHMYDRFGLPYSNTARHDPRDTNGN